MEKIKKIIMLLSNIFCFIFFYLAFLIGVFIIVMIYSISKKNIEVQYLPQSHNVVYPKRYDTFTIMPHIDVYTTKIKDVIEIMEFRTQISQRD